VAVCDEYIARRITCELWTKWTFLTLKQPVDNSKLIIVSCL
jgi:hypothetical protein